ncbi:MAG TPA: cytochrome C [Candidatus Binatia bacterium]|nr:cytochrome C [Candidatus Binatia bacterium]
MRPRTAIAIAAPLAALAVAGALRARADAPPQHHVAKGKDGNVVVALCDGETSMEVDGLKEGEAMPRDKAQAVSDALMAEWRRKNPNARWDDDPPVRVAQAAGGGPSGVGRQAEPADAARAAGPDGDRAAEPAPRGEPDARTNTVPPAPAPAPGLQSGTEKGSENVPVPGAQPPAGQERVQTGIYSAYTDRDEKVWQAATDKFVTDGNTIFHDTKALGGTIGVSCDMCHPNASNTHPETYPKFQVQLGRVAMLRDMINWCIENPVRGKPLRDDDVKLKALEAYILAQRKGVALDYGKH